MKEKLEQEVVQLAQKIINNPLFLKHSGLLLQEIRSIYEKLTILNFLEKNIKDEQEIKKLSQDIEKIYSQVENTQTENTEKHQETPKIHDEKNFEKIDFSDKINQNVETKNSPFLEDILAQVPQDLVFEQKSSINEQVKEPIKTLNDKIVSNQNIQIGLNDKLAFIKHNF